MKPIVIFGAGGFAREVLALIRDINSVSRQWDLLGFLDDDPAAVGDTRDDLDVLGGADWLRTQRTTVHVALGTGNPVTRRRLAHRLQGQVAGFPSLVHPSAILTEYVHIGTGVIVTAGNILTSQIQIGDFAMLNLLCTVGHDVHIGRYATISPGCSISGNVHIGEGCDIGTGTRIVQGMTIGEWSVLGAGAVVSRDIPANCTAVGIPAKPIKERSPGWFND